MSEIKLSSLVTVIVVLLLVTVGGALVFPTVVERLQKRERASALDDDLFVWAIGDSYKIKQDGTLALPVPPSDDSYKASNGVWSGATKTVTLTALKGETLGLQLGIDANVDLTSVDVALGDLVSANGTIPASSLTLFLEWYLQAPFNTDARSIQPGALPRGMYPDALVPFFDPYNAGQRIVNPFALANGMTQPVWVDVAVPTDASAGTYTGTVTVSAQGQPSVDVTLALSVLDATLTTERPIDAQIGLNKAKFMTGMELTDSFTLENATWGSQIWPQYVRFMQLARDHGFESHPLLNPVEPDITTDANDNVTNVDWSLYDQYLGKILDGSVYRDGTPPLSWRLPNRWLGTWETAGDTLATTDRNYITSLGPELVRHFRDDLQWDLAKSYVLGIDEPSLMTVNQYEEERQFADALHAVAPELNLWLPFRPMRLNGIGIESLYGKVDHWMPQGGDYNKAVMDERKAAGDTTWFYQDHEPGLGSYAINADGMGYRVWPWAAWKYGASGFMNWSGTYWDSAQPFVRPDARADEFGWGIGEGTLFYPGVKLSTVGFADVQGPLPSVRMKQLRRGLVDTQLFAMLKGLGEETYLDDTIQTALQTALCQEWNASAPFGTPPHFYCPPYWADQRWTDDPVPPQLPDWDKNPEVWDAAVSDLRVRIAELLAPCVEDWQCDAEWSACVDGTQTRSCIDQNACGTTVEMPPTEQVCTVPCVEQWQCDAEWGACSADGIQTRNCVDQNACGTTTLRPDLQQACTPPCIENWQCDAEWGACSADGIQTRNCVDQNACGTTVERPSLEQSCGAGGPSDAEPPDASFVSVPTGIVKRQTVAVQWTGTDAVSETRNLAYTWQLDTGAWSPYATTTSTSLADLANGTHTIRVRAIDEAGNEDPTPAEATFIVAFHPVVVTANRADAEPRVRVHDPDGTLKKQFLAFPRSFRGGITVAAGDLGVDSIPEIVVGSGPGRRPEVRVFDQNGRQLTKFYAFSSSFRGGVSVAVGNVDGGTADIVVAPLSGKGSNVRVFSWHDGAYRPSTRSVNVYGSRFKKGMSVAAGDLDGDGTDEIMTTPLGGTPQLRVFGVRGGSMRSIMPSINVFAADFRGGVSVAAADMDGDHDDDIVVGAASRSRASLRIYNRGTDGRLTLVREGITAFGASYQGGVSLGAADLDDDGIAEIVAAIRRKEKPYVRILSNVGTLVREFFGAATSMQNGLTVAAGS